MRFEILPANVLNVIRRYPSVYGSLKKARFLLGNVLPPRQYDGVVGRVHFNDDQVGDYSPTGTARYARTGANAVELIEEALSLADRSYRDVASCLDLGSGYGRVLRVLQTKVDPTRITACDTNRSAVGFCAREFGVTPLISKADFREVAFARYDLIWSGSLVTHLSESSLLTLFDVLKDRLAVNGVFVFTTQGDSCLAVEKYGEPYASMHAQIRADFWSKGMAFVPYKHYGRSDIGLAWHSTEYVTNQIERLSAGTFRLLKFTPRGWDNHQDAYAFQRVA